MGLTHWTDAGPAWPCHGEVTDAHDHVVGLYESEQFLVASVVGFVAPVLKAGGSAIVVATGPHRGAIDAALNAEGIDVAGARADGRLVGVDAAEALAQLMVEGAPDPARFAEHMGGLIDAAAAGARDVRVHGEMVALLWDRGEIPAALALEDLWNDLLATRSAALLCAYPMRAFEHEDRTAAFHTMCRQHAAVWPSESYAELADVDAQRRSVALLQQEVIAGINARVALRRRLHELDDELRRAHELGWLRDELIATLQDGLEAAPTRSAARPRSVETFQKRAMRVVRRTLEAVSSAVVVSPPDAEAAREGMPAAGAGEVEVVTVPLPTREAAGGAVRVELAEGRQLDDDGVAFLRTVAQLLAAAFDHERARRRLQLQTARDRLTGLPQRPVLVERIDQAVARCQRHGGRVAVLFIDLDGFKEVNDALGHSVGDAILAAVSQRLAASLRVDDTLARLGGDEFGVLLAPVATADAAVTLAGRLAAVLSAPMAIEGREVSLSASVGVALARHGDTAEELLRESDRAMYRAKARRGRERVQLAQP